MKIWNLRSKLNGKRLLFLDQVRLNNLLVNNVWKEQRQIKTCSWSAKFTNNAQYWKKLVLKVLLKENKQFIKGDGVNKPIQKG